MDNCIACHRGIPKDPLIMSQTHADDPKSLTSLPSVKVTTDATCRSINLVKL